MKLLKSIKELSTYFEKNEAQAGCLADTGFL